MLIKIFVVLRFLVLVFQFQFQSLFSTCCRRKSISNLAGDNAPSIFFVFVHCTCKPVYLFPLVWPTEKGEEEEEESQ